MFSTITLTAGMIGIVPRATFIAPSVQPNFNTFGFFGAPIGTVQTAPSVVFAKHVSLSTIPGVVVFGGMNHHFISPFQNVFGEIALRG